MELGVGMSESASLPHVCLSFPSAQRGINIVVWVSVEASLCICLYINIHIYLYICAVAELHHFCLTLQPLQQQRHMHNADYKRLFSFPSGTDG